MARSDDDLRLTWSGLYVPSWYRETPEPDLSPLDAESFGLQVDGLAAFAAHPEVRCAWEFNVDEGELLGLSFPPGASQIANTGFWIVCPFLPGKLVIHSPIALRAGIFTMQISHGVLFDSNIYDRLVRFVNERETLTSDDVLGVRTLIETLIARKYDYQLIPYVIESFAKNSVEGGYDSALRGIRALLQFHVMDKGYFRATGDLRVDSDALSDYEIDFGTTDLDEIAAKQLEPYTIQKGLPPQVKLWLTSLVTMVLIRRVDKPEKSFDSQWSAFDDFLFNRIGLYQGSHRILALLYFSGHLDRWIRTHRNSKPEEALKALTSSAWDLFLGALPIHILAGCPESAPILSHFCTRETELASLLSMSALQGLRVMHDGRFSPIMAVHTDRLWNAIGTGADRSLKLADDRARDFLRRRDSGTNYSITDSELDALVEEVSERFLSIIGKPRRPLESR